MLNTEKLQLQKNRQPKLLFSFLRELSHASSEKNIQFKIHKYFVFFLRRKQKLDQD